MFGSVLVVLSLVGLIIAQTTTLQAESATLSGVTVATSVAGYTGIYLFRPDMHQLTKVRYGLC